MQLNISRGRGDTAHASSFDRSLHDSTKRLYVGNCELTLVSEEGFGMPDVRHMLENGPFYHGSVLNLVRLEPREIRLGFTLHGTYDNLIVARRLLANSFHPWAGGDLNDQWWTLEKVAGDIRKIDVVYRSGMKYEFIDKDFDEIPLSVSLLAPYPLFYGITLVEELILGSGIAGAQDDTEDLNYGGDWPTRLVSLRWTGVAEDPKITNNTTGEVLELDGFTVNAARPITFTWGNDPGDWAITETTTNADLSEYLTPGSDIDTFHLASWAESTDINGKNTIRLQSPNAGPWTTLRLAYSNKYLTA